MHYLRSLWPKLTEEHRVIILMLFLGLLVGLIFIFVVPPWQHYDEPTHFEYVWLIANRPGLPTFGEYDQAMRREVAASMIEHDFFRGMGFTPNLLSSVEPIWLGISQTGGSPLYYWLASIPLKLLRTTDITFQLYTLRILSLVFYLATILAAYGIAAEIKPEKHPLRWLLPTTILLLPGFVDIFTAVNDDIGATAFFSLFLWVGIRLLYRGFSWIRSIIFVLLAGICFYTKNTVIIALILSAIPLVFSIAPRGKRQFVWVSIAGIILLGLLSVFSWGDPASWYKTSSPSSSTRSINLQSPVGNKVFEFVLSPDTGSNQFSQIISPEMIAEENLTMTTGAWIWADRPTIVHTPILRAGSQSISKTVNVTSEPKFFALSETIDSNSALMTVNLSPVQSTMVEPLIVYYDGVVVVEGIWQEDSPPNFNGPMGGKGSWGGKEFVNLVRNPSAELSGPQLRGWVEAFITSRIPGNPTQIMGLLFDPIPIYSYYITTGKILFQTFWARFGWGHVVVKGFHPYTILGLFTLAGLIPALAAFYRKRKEIRWEAVLFLGLALVVIWGAAFLRGLPSILAGSYYIPVARYAYPVIIPTMLILNIGWLEAIRWFEKYFRVPQRISLGFLVGCLLLLYILSVFSIYQFYNQ